MTDVFHWNPGFEPDMKAHLQWAQKRIDSDILRLSAPYIPFQQGTLQQSGQLGTVIGSGIIMWIAPYAHYHYRGEVMAGPAPKKYTGRQMKYHGGPKRGAQWFERMKQDHAQDIVANAQAAFRGGKL